MAKTFRRNNDDDDDELLKDGQRMRVPMMLRDSQTLHDGRGGTPGHRPGFVYTHDAYARDEAEIAHYEYRLYLQNAWRNPPTVKAHEGDLLPDGTDDHLTTDAKQAAYDAYDENLRNQWRRP